MRIEEFSHESRGGLVGIRARVVWEDSNRDPFELRFPANAPLDVLAASGGNPFLVACAFSARHRGERRIRVEEALCPVLRDGVRAASRLLAAWYGGASDSTIEAAKGFRTFPARAPRAGMFLSGGVDSLHVLMQNRRIYPRDHPASFRTAVFVPYASFPDPSPDERARQVVFRQQRAVESLASRAELELAIVDTNSAAVEPDFDFMVAQSHGASLIAAAHALTARLGTVALATSFEIPRALLPYGSHPLLDPLYGSSCLDVFHEGIGLSRLDKIRQLAEWDLARDLLMVCFEGPLPSGQLNCGECEKCLRTMAGLLVAGRLDHFPVFGRARLDAEAILSMPMGYHLHAFRHYWGPIAASLREQGRRGLATAIDRRVREASRLQAWIEQRDWKGTLRRFDRRVLGGAGTSRLRAMRASRGQRK
ncbi:MAG: hypothetical protein ACRD16_11370 [Thermoanaerobaculia bacterium]